MLQVPHKKVLQKCSPPSPHPCISYRNHTKPCFAAHGRNQLKKMVFSFRVQVPFESALPQKVSGLSSFFYLDCASSFLDAFLKDQSKSGREEFHAEGDCFSPLPSKTAYSSTLDVQHGFLTWGYQHHPAIALPEGTVAYSPAYVTVRFSHQEQILPTTSAAIHKPLLLIFPNITYGHAVYIYVRYF